MAKKSAPISREPAPTPAPPPKREPRTFSDCGPSPKLEPGFYPHGNIGEGAFVEIGARHLDARIASHRASELAGQFVNTLLSTPALSMKFERGSMNKGTAEELVEICKCMALGVVKIRTDGQAVQP